MMSGLFNFGKAAPKRSRYDIPLGEPENAAASGINNAASSFTSSNFIDWYTMGMQTAGVLVSEQTAMQVGAVYACVSLIGGTIASMPLPVYQRTPTGNILTDHDVWWLLNEEPHPDYSAAIFWESMLASLLLHGNAYARIIRPNIYSDKITAFQWLHPRRVQVTRDNGQLIYTVQNDLYSQNGDDTSAKSYVAQDIIHIAGPGFNGLIGMSQIRYVLRHAAGIALAADQYSADFFQNGARPDFALVAPQKPTDDQVRQLRESWAERHKGVGNQHQPGLLYGGWDIKELSMSVEDTQLMATRNFQVGDIARIYGIPPHMIGLTEANTSWGTGVEQMSMGFVKYTLARYTNKIAMELNRKIWPLRQRYFVKFDPTDLERGDYATRMNGYRAALGRAGEQSWMTANEVRQAENLPPLANGDKLHEANPNAPADKTTSDK